MNDSQVYSSERLNESNFLFSSEISSEDSLAYAENYIILQDSTTPVLPRATSNPWYYRLER